MFYVDQLLSKTGPLAKVWLAANIERKLSKSQVLQSDIDQDIKVILNQNNAPMALRLHGNLMLGVVRIYGKKAKYLQDDCHEALLKIRMTFKNTGSHDLPANAITGTDLNLPELLTIDDLFPAMDFAYPTMSQKPALPGPTQDYDNDWTSSLNPRMSGQSRMSPGDDVMIHDDDLQLDFGDNEDTTVSIQQGRNAPADLNDQTLGGEQFYKDDDLVLDFGDNEPPLPTTNDDDMPLPMDDDEGHIILPEDETAQIRGSTVPQSRRGTSPLSDLNPEEARDLDTTFNQPTAEDETTTSIAVQQKQRSKKFKPIEPDLETVLHNREIKAQSEDRSKILKAPQFLPRDPSLLNLMNLSKSGAFVNTTDTNSLWAPELQGLLSFDAVLRFSSSSNQRKRKRDSGIAGISDSEEEQASKSPRIEDPEDEGIGAEDHHSPIDPSNPALQDIVTGEDDEGIFGLDDSHPNFDDTTIPLIHPADSGAVSLGTKRAVHLLREKLGGSETSSSPKKSVLLQDIIPEGRASREDATKMFFETLVLATKDAIKVEQGGGALGLPLRIRGKRGLWGSWAEDVRADQEGDESVGVPETGRVVEVAA
ncbi:Cohesin subunit rad21 [Cyphellophora attinorum]|uniref:Cohesin subunit rad21 n=1 Tax=Cyphellophora attinorum TaxID=1664694 RepID=A0A0N0NLU3_9EURO|nr:Cohesin subunit rad21 [Phialophora attinorum]KPI39439.1 Cohesin subunit rad21 [Phialophora attinorum]